jgi:hypothetical protein
VTCTAKMLLCGTGEALLYKTHIAKLYANPENVRSGNRWRKCGRCDINRNNATMFVERAKNQITKFRILSQIRFWLRGHVLG